MKINLPPMPDKIFGIESGMITVLVPLVVVVIVAIVGFNLVVAPKYTDYQEMTRALKLMESQNKDVLDKIRYLQSIDQNELKKNEDSISSALLPQKSSYLLVGVIKKIADKYGFQIDSFSISPGKLEKEDTVTAKKATSVPKIPIQVSIVGQKSDYLKLLKGLERSLPVLSLKSFKMAAVGNMVKLDMDIFAFYLQDNFKMDINKISLSDLTLKKEETDLISTLGEFTITESSDEMELRSGQKKDLIKYTRNDPFSL